MLVTKIFVHISQWVLHEGYYWWQNVTLPPAPPCHCESVWLVGCVHPLSRASSLQWQSWSSSVCRIIAPATCDDVTQTWVLHCSLCVSIFYFLHLLQPSTAPRCCAVPCRAVLSCAPVMWPSHHAVHFPLCTAHTQKAFRSLYTCRWLVWRDG